MAIDRVQVLLDSLKKAKKRYDKVVQEYNDVVKLYSELNDKYEKEKKVREHKEF